MTEAIRAAALGELPHGFLTRTGDGTLGEREEAWAAAAVLPGARVIRPKQIHSPDCVVVNEPWDGERPEADAVVTAVPGMLIGVITADCAPVLLADTQVGVVGAAHAGWRGAHAGVIENTVAAMESLGARAERIAAAIGPCIAQPSYEVDAAFREAFGPEDKPFFVAGRADHWQFDLEGYVADRLIRAGVGRVERLRLDTYADPQRFHSYRRATHRGTADKGRQLSLIGL